jgi:hypothetical protein
VLSEQQQSRAIELALDLRRHSIKALLDTCTPVVA